MLPALFPWPVCIEPFHRTRQSGSEWEKAGAQVGARRPRRERQTRESLSRNCSYNCTKVNARPLLPAELAARDFGGMVPPPALPCIRATDSITHRPLQSPPPPQSGAPTPASIYICTSREPRERFIPLAARHLMASFSHF